jgi:hypothetical protein
MCLLAFPVMASHIVGGEFELVYVSGSSYRVNLILYFDKKNGQAGAKDQNITASIFRKRDNAHMMYVYLSKPTETLVEYTQPECIISELLTSKLVYTTLIDLPASDFDDPLGYYIVWERCCRNYNEVDNHDVLINIISEVPAGNNDPNAAGQTFILEFPPVVKNGKPFINSSPQLFPPLSDYGCSGQPYYTDFAGTDADGDSLVYSIVTPLNTHSSAAIPEPGPMPFEEVKWKFPYSLHNILGGNPDLKISSDGLLTVTPGKATGLFVFAVKCEEFRNGEKIGELRRDFQMFVVNCKIAAPPKILGRKLGATSFTYENTMPLTFSNTVSDENRCIEVQVTDNDM